MCRDAAQAVYAAQGSAGTAHIASRPVETPRGQHISIFWRMGDMSIKDSF